MSEGNNYPSVFCLSGHHKCASLPVTVRCSFPHTKPKPEIMPAPFWNVFVSSVPTLRLKLSPVSPEQMHHNFLLTAYTNHHQPLHLRAKRSRCKYLLWQNRKLSVTTEWSFAKETKTNVYDSCLISALPVQSPCPSRRRQPTCLGRNGRQHHTATGASRSRLGRWG